MLKLRLIHGFLILFLLAFAINPMNGQQGLPDKTVTIDKQDVTLENLLNSITGLTGVPFSYSPSKIRSDQILSYSCMDRNIKQVIEDICRVAGLSHSVVNKYVILKPSDEESILPVKPRTFTISGTIRDSATNETMIGATVYVPETGIGAVSNNFGFFSLTLPQGSYTIQAAFLGYSRKVYNLQLEKDVALNISMPQIPFTMKEIVISSVDNEKAVFASLAAQTHIDPSQVQRLSAALGETDLLKSLDNLPGISFQSDGSSYFSVRGGARDQNLILLDDAPIFNPSHLLGLFTPIIPEAIKNTEVYRADFPVQYGGRLSSVIDIRARDGNMSGLSGNASIGPVSTRFSLEGPFRKNSSSWFLSYRISTFGLLVKAANPSVQKFYFTDFTTKFNFRLGKRDRLFLTLFAGKDEFINKPGLIRNGVAWSNSTGTLRWLHIFGSRLFSNTTLYASKYDYLLFTNMDENMYWNSHITSSNLKSEFTWYISPRNTFRYGINISGYFFNPGNYLNAGNTLDHLKVSQVNSSELVVYAGDEAEITGWMKINAGLRYSNWSNYGEAFIYGYDDDYNPVSWIEIEKGKRYYSKSFVEPRISLSLKTGKTASFKVSYNRTIQHINQINNSISPLNALEVWLPSGPNIKPQYSDIFDIGFVKIWPEKSWEFTADIYYRELYNQLAYAAHAEILLNPYLEGEFRQGGGNSYGYEILVRKKSGRFTGQAGLGSSRSFLKISDLNDGIEYRSHFDKPFDFSVSAEYRIGKRWTVNTNIVAASGMVLTTPSGFIEYRGFQVPYYSKLNNDRLPAYRRVDLGSTWQLNRPGKAFEHFFNISFYNFFNTRNYAFLNFNKVKGADDKFYIPADQLSPRMQISTYRYIYSVIPSFNYSLRF